MYSAALDVEPGDECSPLLVASVEADVEPDAELEPVEPVDEVVLTVEPVAGEPLTDVDAAAVVLNASKVFAAVGLTAKTMPDWQCLRE